jgi:origin recognition complex subunit 4
MEYHGIQDVADSQTFVDGLSELEIALLICAARAEVKLDADALNFNLAYDEYLEVANKVRQERSAAMGNLTSTANGNTVMVTGYRIWSKTLARAAWERLGSLELVVPADAKAKKVSDELRLMKVDVGLMELSRMIGDSHPLYRWTKI